MPRRFDPFHRLRRTAAVIAITCAGLGAAALVSVAVARTFTISVAKGVSVTNQAGSTSLENVAVNARGHALYTLSGDTKSNPKCTKASGCWSFWPPLKVSSSAKPTKASGISGRLGVWHHSGIAQVTLNGHPLYAFSMDSKSRQVHGEGIVGFGGTWHVVKAAGTSSSTGTTNTTSTTPTYPSY
jgi:predicted lipoprotein with Yx(FWY)xxD motif